MGSVPGQAVKISKRDLSLPGWARNIYHRLQSGQSDAHIGGKDGDALLAGTQDGHDAVVTRNGGTAAPRFTLVAGSVGIVKIIATGSLQQISTIGRHIPYLGRSAGKNGFGQ